MPEVRVSRGWDWREWVGLGCKSRQTLSPGTSFLSEGCLLALKKKDLAKIGT